MSRLCLDTSAYSHYKRGHEAVTQLVVRAGMIFMPTIVLGELRAGFRMGRHGPRNEAELREFLAHPVVSVLEVDEESASHYAGLVHDLRRLGRPLPTNDVWIGALALRAGATVVTYDRHFNAMEAVGRWVLSAD